MKKTVYALWLALALVCAAVQAEPPVTSDGRAAATGKSKDTQAPPTAGRPKGQKPADSFTPSEKVGADSAVTFPVDI